MALARALVASLSLVPSLLGQGPPANGPATSDPAFAALVHGTVVVEPGTRIDDATLVIRDGRVVRVERGAAPPPGAAVHDCTGLTLYPGLIEPYLTVDAPAPDRDAPMVHWHPMVLAQRSALDGDGTTDKDREQLRALGFAAAAIAPTGGVFKGSGAVVLLDEPATGERAAVVRDAAYQLCSLQRDWGSHPSSEMGAIALLRQVLSDADWYERCNATAARVPALAAAAPAPNAALAALAAQRALPLAFDADDELQVLRMAKVAAEFERQAFAIGSGMEFRRLAAIAATGLPMVVPLHFPDPPDVSTVAKAERTSLRQLQSWEQAPSNLQRLLQANVRVALTTARLDDRKEFRKALAAALRYGVDADRALAALTTVPAELLGVAQDLGTLQPGRIANVVAVEGDLFDPKARIDAVWVAGRRHEVTAAKPKAFDGLWSASIARAEPVQVELTVTGDKVKAKLGDRKAKVRGARVDDARLEFLLQDAALGDDACWVRGRLRDGTLVGSVHTADGVVALRGERTGDAPAADARQADADEDKAKDKDDAEDQDDADATDEVKATPPLATPLGGYGVTEPPRPRTAVFTGATLWTCGDAGTIELGALFVRDGKVVFAGRREDLPAVPDDAERRDCTGKHITPGLIDCHSHTGISRGVNEGGEAVTAEVRIQDVIDPDDVNWYRQLAGGVTAVNQLHGSANAIGGQSCTTKVRWGVQHPDEMRMQGAVDGIKFALGENPRRANSREPGDRYPNTRMGVEALIRDRFLAAVDYRRRLQEYEALQPKARAAVLPPRRDLELEALAEILAGARRVHCHSYRQDEIFMLCQVAQEFGFRIGTFQHVLEGYKVAEAIREAAVGASAFSDWWAYKFEVYDAIPENGAILYEAGVCTSFNSDSNEHARRLNTEAGKAVKYGGVPPPEALKFVTRNPAIQLGVQDRIGSLERGMDADFAIWSGDPLSYASVCESTWVDGAERFSRSRDQQLRREIERERRRLLQLALDAGKSGRTDKGDQRDAYWAAEDDSDDYCCRECEGGVR
ncbi:MAG: amidohydrolase family protein [Planctomycetota bacterium]